MEDPELTKITIQTPDGPKEVSIPWKPVLVIGLLIIGFLIVNSTYYTIETGEVGVETRFGKYLKTTSPGLHFKLPWGIDDVTPVKVDYVYKEEFGYQTLEADVQTRYAPESRKFEDISLMLTGDLNCALLTWSIQYDIKDPKAFLFNIREPIITLRDMTESVMREAVGDRSVTDVLTSGKEAIMADVGLMLQDTLDSYNAGINIREVVLKAVNPPNEVKASFNEVNQAQQEKEKAIEDAWKGYNKVIPEAEGVANKMISEAEGYAVERTNIALGDVARFNNLLVEYRKAKDITRWRLYIEAMSEVLPKIERKTIIDSEVQSLLPLLDLGSEGRAK